MLKWLVLLEGFVLVLFALLVVAISKFVDRYEIEPEQTAVASGNFFLFGYVNIVMIRHVKCFTQDEESFRKTVSDLWLTPAIVAIRIRNKPSSNRLILFEESLSYRRCSSNIFRFTAHLLGSLSLHSHSHRGQIRSAIGRQVHRGARQTGFVFGHDARDVRLLRCERPEV